MLTPFPHPQGHSRACTAHTVWRDAVLCMSPENLAVVIEERHGFNKQTRALFFMDVAKTLLLGGLLLPPLVGGFTWLLARAGPWVPLQLWAFFFAIALLMMTIYPTCE